MICALDTEGRIYVALTQVNTNEDVYSSFLSRLVNVMCQEDKDFRTNTIFVMDGASYHKSKRVALTLKKLGVNYMIAGPYAYDVQPIEYWFSYFKSEQINPQHLKTGKK